MGNRTVDILVDSGPSGHFVVLKSDGIEIERARFDTREAAMRCRDAMLEKARQYAAATQSREEVSVVRRDDDPEAK
jgi:hypothetical protein